MALRLGLANLGRRSTLFLRLRREHLRGRLVLSLDAGHGAPRLLEAEPAARARELRGILCVAGARRPRWPPTLVLQGTNPRYASPAWARWPFTQSSPRHRPRHQAAPRFALAEL